MGINLSVLILLILINGFLAASEVALLSLNKSKIKLMAKEGDEKAARLSKFLTDSSRFLATIQIGITLSGFLASALAADRFSEKVARFIYDSGFQAIELFILETIALVVVTMILSYFTLVFGELVPKRLAMEKAETIALLAIGPLIFLAKAASPFIKILSLSTDFVVRLFGVDPKKSERKVTEEEIRMLLNIGRKTGTIQEDESMMIENVFEFNDKTVAEIMTHRTNIAAIPIDYTLEETLRLINNESYTRFPVYEDNIDNILGILHIKNVLKYLEEGHDKEFDLRKLIYPPHFVLESKKIDEFFAEMQKNRHHMAIVIDEYGGTYGLATIEDALEEIVGNISDEYDRTDPSEEIEQINENTFIMDGMIRLYEVEDAIGVEITDEDLDTLGGFIIDELGYIPEKREKPSIEYGNIEFTVLEMDKKRIKKVKVRLKENEKKEGDE